MVAVVAAERLHRADEVGERLEVVGALERPAGLHRWEAPAFGTVVGLAADDGAERRRFPPVEPRWAFERTNYLESFPDLIGSVQSFRGDDRDHARLLAAVDAGDDWSSILEPADVMLCPAVCH